MKIKVFVWTVCEFGDFHVFHTHRPKEGQNDPPGLPKWSPKGPPGTPGGVKSRPRIPPEAPQKLPINFLGARKASWIDFRASSDKLRI